MKTRSEVISKLQEIKPVLQKEWAVKIVGLFGSFADESNTASSDIDILVEFSSPVGWRFFSLETYLEKELNHKIDLVTKNALKEQIKPVILNQVQYI